MMSRECYSLVLIYLLEQSMPRPRTPHRDPFARNIKSKESVSRAHLVLPPNPHSLLAYPLPKLRRKSQVLRIRHTGKHDRVDHLRTQRMLHETHLRTMIWKSNRLIWLSRLGSLIWSCSVNTTLNYYSLRWGLTPLSHHERRLGDIEFNLVACDDDDVSTSLD
jgi:hypothetical protein